MSVFPASVNANKTISTGKHIGHPDLDSPMLWLLFQMVLGCVKVTEVTITKVFNIRLNHNKKTTLHCRWTNEDNNSKCWGAHTPLWECARD